jgi:hypothetical protein
MSRVFPTLGALLIVLGLASSAYAVPRIYKPPVDAWGDGAHRLVWQRGSSVYVLDDGRSWRDARTLHAPAGCGHFADAGSGYALFGCHGSDRPGDYTVAPLILNLRTGAITAPAGAAALLAWERSANYDSFKATAIGSSLLELSYGGYHYSGDVEWNWRHGGLFKHLDPSSEGGLMARRHVFDLNYPTGLRPLCAPLRIGLFRQLDDISGFPIDFTELVGFAHPYLVTTDKRDVMRIERCGSGHTRILGQPYNEPLVTRKYLAWSTANSLRVLMLKTRRSYEWRLPQPGSPSGTSGTVLVPIALGRSGRCPCGTRAVDLTRRR